MNAWKQRYPDRAGHADRPGFGIKDSELLPITYVYGQGEARGARPVRENDEDNVPRRRKFTLLTLTEEKEAINEEALELGEIRKMKAALLAQRVSEQDVDTAESRVGLNPPSIVESSGDEVVSEAAIEVDEGVTKAVINVDEGDVVTPDVAMPPTDAQQRSVPSNQPPPLRQLTPTQPDLPLVCEYYFTQILDICMCVVCDKPRIFNVLLFA